MRQVRTDMIGLIKQARRNRLSALYAKAAAERNIFAGPRDGASVRRRPVFRTCRTVVPG